MSPTLWLVASSLGIGVLLALVVIYRRAATRRELELAEELLEDEYRAVERR